MSIPHRALARTATFAAYWPATQPHDMTRITLIPKHQASPDLRRAYATVATLWGMRGEPPLVAQIVQCFSHRPFMVEQVGFGYRYVGWGGRLPRTVREFTAVLVSRENDCFY